MVTTIPEERIIRARHWADVVHYLRLATALDADWMCSQILFTIDAPPMSISTSGWGRTLIRLALDLSLRLLPLMLGAEALARYG